MSEAGGLQLPEAPEPISLKRLAQEDRRNYPAWNSDSLRVSHPKGLASYLWTVCRWGSKLKVVGMTWQGFIGTVANQKRYTRRWVRDELSWETLLAQIRGSCLRFFTPVR